MSLEYRSVSKSQLDKLGSRLRNSAEPDDEDLVLLNRYREQFIAVTDAVLGRLRQLTDFSIESRHKSIPSIVAKLRRRRPARLSAIQDLAGARIVVPTLSEQDEVVKKLVANYPDATIDDKRTRPTHSYRAVHVVIEAPLPFEIQVRTEAQHIWAQFSEGLADSYGFELKYGGGPQRIATALAAYSDWLADWDRLMVVDWSSRGDELRGTVKTYLERFRTIIEGFKTQ